MEQIVNYTNEQESHDSFKGMWQLRHIDPNCPIKFFLIFLLNYLKIWTWTWKYQMKYEVISFSFLFCFYDWQKKESKEKF